MWTWLGKMSLKNCISQGRWQRVFKRTVFSGFCNRECVHIPAMHEHWTKWRDKFRPFEHESSFFMSQPPKTKPRWDRVKSCLPFLGSTLLDVSLAFLWQYIRNASQMTNGAVILFDTRTGHMVGTKTKSKTKTGLKTRAGTLLVSWGRNPNAAIQSNLVPSSTLVLRTLQLWDNCGCLVVSWNVASLHHNRETRVLIAYSHNTLLDYAFPHSMLETFKRSTLLPMQANVHSRPQISHGYNFSKCHSKVDFVKTYFVWFHVFHSHNKIPIKWLFLLFLSQKTGKQLFEKSIVRFRNSHHSSKLVSAGQKWEKLLRFETTFRQNASDLSDPDTRNCRRWKWLPFFLTSSLTCRYKVFFFSVETNLRKSVWPNFDFESWIQHLQSQEHFYGLLKAHLGSC